MYWRWSIWLVSVATWTWALLVPNPGEWARALILPDSAETGNGSQLRLQLLLFVTSFVFSKGMHIAGYAVLTVLSAWLRVKRRRRWLLLAFLSVHALGTEFSQGFVATRHPSWRDVGLDHLGIALGLSLTWKQWLAKSARAGDSVRFPHL